MAPAAATVLTWSGVVSGAGGLEKLDAGRLELSGANTYSGGTRLSGGILSIGADTALGADLERAAVAHGRLRPRTSSIHASIRSHHA